MLCKFTSTPAPDGKYRHVCRVCGAEYVLADKRVNRQCDRLGVGDFAAMAISVVTLNLITPKRASAGLRWATRGNVKECKCKTWRAWLNRWVWPF